MSFSNLSIVKKIVALMMVMGLSGGLIALVGARGLSALDATIVDVGAKEETAREAMDLRVDIIAISRMTYQLAAEPAKAADFAVETDKRTGEMLARLPKIASTADQTEIGLIDEIRKQLETYFAQVRAMVDLAAKTGSADPAAMKASLGAALAAQKNVTAAVKAYSTYSGTALADARAQALQSSSVAMIVLVAGSIGSIVVGLLISMLFARSGIVKPVRNLTETMSRLARGEMDGEGADILRRDEIGEMARAVEVFRKDALQMRAMKQQEEALQAMSSDLQSNISLVVAAAVAGDFTARITKDYQHEDLDRFAASVNELVASVDQAVAQVSRVMAALADSDLTDSMQGTFQGAFAELQTNMNATMITLRATMNDVRGVASTINGNSAELSAAANDLSKRTEQQAASLEETAAALDEITTTVRTSADRANEARGMVRETRESAGKSGAIVRNAVEAMGRIEESSQRISQIIAVIDEIAFQTNLLALNAGVEAARAGDAGRGFAVVAQEVRELAQRSATAAKEIKTLINASAAQVGSGVALVRSTGEALVEIESLVHKVDTHVISIATAAGEQAAALLEINASVNQMDQMTQQNAAMVEETTAASETLASESRQLNDLLAKFRLEDDRTRDATRGRTMSSAPERKGRRAA